VSPGAFSRYTAALLAGAAALSLAATFALGALGDLAEPGGAGADGYSRSAIGHRAFLDLVRQEGRTVLLSRSRTSQKARGDVITALLEPGLGLDGERAPAVLSDIRQAASQLLVVLPKREGVPDGLRPRWVSAVRPAPIDAAERILKALHLDAEVVRGVDSLGHLDGPLPTPELLEPQLVRSNELKPLLSSTEGILVGERVEGEKRLLLVADPDVLETHGLGRGQNAELALALLDRLGPGKALLVDETLHGHEITPSITRELFRFPLVLATVQALATLALLGWAALVRFGRPLPPSPPFAPGKALLVENTAELLRAGGHAGEAARAYLRAAREEVLSRLPPPGGAETPEAWLRRLEATRERSGDLARLTSRVERIVDGRRGAATEAVRAALQISRWREEMTHGTPSHPGPRRGPPG